MEDSSSVCETIDAVLLLLVQMCSATSTCVCGNVGTIKLRCISVVMNATSSLEVLGI